MLAEDDDTYAPADQLPDISEDLDANPEWRAKIRKERVLFVGWRRDMHDMISVLDQFVAKGSELYLYNEVTNTCAAHTFIACCLTVLTGSFMPHCGNLQSDMSDMQESCLAMGSEQSGQPLPLSCLTASVLSYKIMRASGMI